MKHSVIASNGIDLNVVETGSGPAVLFCHGFPDTWRTWRRLMHGVAQAGFRAIALDLRGFGESSAPRGADQYTLYHTVGDLVGLLDALQIESAALVGHDWGAYLAWHAALMRPDRFSAVFGISVPYQPRGQVNFLDQLKSAGVPYFYMQDQMRPEADAMWADATRSIPSVLYHTSSSAPAEQRFSPFDPRRGLVRPVTVPLPAWIDPCYLDETIAQFQRSGFRGGLNWYRAIPLSFELLAPFAFARMMQPGFYLVGADEGLHEMHRPTESQLRSAAPRLLGMKTLAGVGHHPQHEAPDETEILLLQFLGHVTP